MKKTLALVLAVFTLFALCACRKTPAVQEEESVRKLLDDCVRLAQSFDEELARKVMPEGMYDYYVSEYANRDQDFIALLRDQFAESQTHYAQTYGEDWKITYEMLEEIEKDAEGVQNYIEFDSYYFRSYGIDTDKIEAVTFAKVRMHIEGSLDSNEKDKTIQCFLIDGKWYSFYAVMMGLRL